MDDVDGRMARKFQLTSSIGATLDLGTDVTAHFMVTASALCYPLVECDTLTFSISLASFCTAVVLQQVYDDMLELACGTPSVAASDTAAYALGFCEKELPRAKAKKLAPDFEIRSDSSDREVMVGAIKANRSDFDDSGKSDEYIKAAFDFAQPGAEGWCKRSA